jgi:hypothetical protein
MPSSLYKALVEVGRKVRHLPVSRRSTAGGDSAAIPGGSRLGRPVLAGSLALATLATLRLPPPPQRIIAARVSQNASWFQALSLQNAARSCRTSQAVTAASDELGGVPTPRALPLATQNGLAA